VGGGPGPSPGFYLPQRGFGAVWAGDPHVRQCLGYDKQRQAFGPDVLVAVPGAAYALDIRSFDGKPLGRYARYAPRCHRPCPSTTRRDVRRVVSWRGLIATRPAARRSVAPAHSTRVYRQQAAINLLPCRSRFC